MLLRITDIPRRRVRPIANHMIAMAGFGELGDAISFTVESFGAYHLEHEDGRPYLDGFTVAIDVSGLFTVDSSTDDLADCAGELIDVDGAGTDLKWEASCREIVSRDGKTWAVYEVEQA